MSSFARRASAPTLAAALTLTLLCGGLLPGAAADDDTPPSGYPSWSDVQKAKQSEGAKTAEITTINGLLGHLEAEAEKRGNAAVVASGAYAVADAALNVAKAKVDGLSAQLRQATAEAARYRKEYGALAVQAYKNGSLDLPGIPDLQSIQPDRLQGLSVLQVVTGRASALLAKSSAAENTVQSLTDQEQRAEAERQRLADDARQKLDAAQAAKSAMDTQLAQQKQHGQELTAQLASLKGTTASVEARYQQGQEALAAYEAAQAAKRAAAEERAREQAAAAAAEQQREQQQATAQAAANAQQAGSASGPAPSTPDPTPQPPVVVPPDTGGAVNDPAGAQSYAAGRLGSYGWGQDQFQCLQLLWTQESSWLTTATNASSGAYGIAQALPAGKYASAGSDWLTNYRTQIEWGLGYIRDRYGSPCGAWAHEVSNNWY
ncbi:lytic transglycosylase domain-containing protein [Arthrobacter sp. Y-9]|uniref:aggregation-promoting factor C-terminal-like domain-containing protein n=1 Tax=Arthrobacter sp. Y-9 TaxID=3039385 RepID=UPI00241BF3DF|nr:lytic transglycosylase domain-containing protein [Arthrobacter sp. Y-9]WFR85352.1 lytic transglycosylase domain-containing protein [Arthrobacter sp. Y-9]